MEIADYLNNFSIQCGWSKGEATVLNFRLCDRVSESIFCRTKQFKSRIATKGIFNFTHKIFSF